MNDFTFPGMRPVAFGVNRIEQLAEDVLSLTGKKGGPVVLITDTGLARTGIVKRVSSILTTAGYHVFAYSDLQGEPHAHEVDAATGLIRNVMRDEGNPCVIGLGGGSAMDTAKLAAVIAADKDPAAAYALCDRPLPRPVLKRILIPTTAGTGSEVTLNSIFTLENNRKVWAWGEELLPDLALLDPGLTVSMPEHITAGSGMDALVHAIEACTCRNKNPISDALGLHAVRLVKRHLVTAINTPHDMDARGGMLLASTIAGGAFAVTGTAVAHAIGHALSTISHIPHGRAVAVAMEAALRWNTEGDPEAHAAVAQALGAPKKAEAAASAFTALMDQTGIDRSLTKYRIDPETLAKTMMSEENLPMMENNSREITPDDALELARRALNMK